jgi:hypothetical protein
LPRGARRSRTLPGRGKLAAAFVAVLLAGCGGHTSAGGVTILRYGPTNGSPAALATGTLRYLDGCVVLDTLDPNGAPHGQVILWPPTAGLQVVGGRVFVTDGGVMATDGDAIRLGGGEQTDQAFVDGLVSGVGKCKSDVYWMASSLELVDR